MSVAVIGAGAWGKNLVREFHKLGVLSAVVEADRSKHAALKASYPQAEIFESKDCLSPHTTPSVAIATPVSSHFADASWGLEQGYDVFVEKPMVASLPEAQKLAQIAKDTSRLLMVGHLLLYQPAIRWIDNFLQEDGLGKIISVRQRRMNHGRIRTQENVLWSLGVHDIAVLLHLLKQKPQAVKAFGHAYFQPKVADEITLNLRFKENIDASLEVSWIWPVKERSLTVIGTKGALVFDEVTQTVTLHRKSFSADLASQDKGSEVVFTQKEEALPFELKHFLSCVQTRQTPLSSLQNGLDVVEVLAQADSSLGNT